MGLHAGVIEERHDQTTSTLCCVAGWMTWAIRWPRHNRGGIHMARVPKSWREIAGAILAILGLVAASGAFAGIASAATNSASTHKLKTVVFIIAGQAHDGGYYQGQVESLQKAAKKQHYKVTVVEQVAPAAAQAAFQSAVRQSPSLIIGDLSLNDGFTAACQQQTTKAIGWIGQASFPPTCKIAADVYQDNSQAHYLAGVAVGEYLKTAGKPNGTLVSVAGPKLNFVQTDNDALEQGLKAADPTANFRIVFTGDFNNAALASEATKSQIALGADVIYPYLAGGLVPAMQAATAQNVPLLSNSLNGCLAPSTPGSFKFIGSILNNPAPFLPDVVNQYATGKLATGSVRIYHVDWPGIGANICNATPAEQSALDAARADLLSGKIKITNSPYTGTKTTK